MECRHERCVRRNATVLTWMPENSVGVERRGTPQTQNHDGGLSAGTEDHTRKAGAARSMDRFRRRIAWPNFRTLVQEML
jgi:hypothetical protein